MNILSRAHDGMIARWWWSVDRWGLGCIIFLMVVGIIMGLAASPAVASKLGLEQYHFVKRQLFFVGLSSIIIVVCSLLSPVGVRRAAYVLLGLSVLALLATLVLGVEIKGARRWIYVGGLSLQPSEFLKPALMVVTADLMSRQEKVFGRIDGTLLAFFGLLTCVGILVLQPDIGQTILIGAAWVGVLFLSGVRLVWAAIFAPVGGLGVLFAYFSLPHVAKRIDAFLDPQRAENFQVNKALDAAVHGGIIGVGPGEGELKRTLPDAHTDFIFAVALEEYGLIACTLIVGTFAILVLRSMARARHHASSFSQLAVGGLVIVIGLQAFLNMAVSLGMVPTTGMTLPFISYGGTSLLAMAVSAGFLLAMTRRRPGMMGGLS